MDWITFNARNYAVRNSPESPVTASMSGQCAPTQRINVNLLRRFGLDARAFNTADCIGEIPLSEDDRQKVANGWNSPAVRHSVSLVNLPIMDDSGYTQSYKFLLDPTFRQFCLKENCNVNKFYDSNWLSRGYPAPHPGYFMQADNLLQLGVSAETAQETEALGQYLISKGYFCLNESTAKLYGDAFVRASKRIEFQNYPIYMSGNDYINNFENIPMQMLGNNKGDNDFLKLPSETLNEKQSIFSKIKNFFKEKFGNKTKMLPQGDPAATVRKPRLESVQLTQEQYEQYKQGTAEVLREYNENQYSGQTTTLGDYNREEL